MKHPIHKLLLAIAAAIFPLNPCPAQEAKPASVPVTAADVRAARRVREQFLADPYRPGYHFCVPDDVAEQGALDPNGAFYHNGRYHLMYLYNRNGAPFGPDGAGVGPPSGPSVAAQASADAGCSWGHVSSQDLVHWRHHPDAIGPGQGDEGCFSGGAFVDDDGTAYLSYWMVWSARGIGIAKSRSSGSFDSWEKLATNPVIRSTEWGVTEAKDSNGKTFCYGSADPSNIWKKDGRYYMLTGNLLVLWKTQAAPNPPPGELGDRAYLFASDNLKDWKYQHVFYERKGTDPREDCMCPSFLPLPSSAEGGKPSGKHLLLFISHSDGCQYYVGDYRNDKFYPDNHGRMTKVDSEYFAPEALVDGQGRQIMWAWLADWPPGYKMRGWSGVYGLPRSLWLGEDGTLRMQPVKELQMLRSHEKSWNAMTLADGETKTLESVVGNSCEIAIDVEMGTAPRCGLKVLASSDGKEETLLYYDTNAKELCFDATRSGVEGRKVVEHLPLELKPGEPLKLRVFVDKSVVEIYANDRQAICRMVYPSRPDSLGVVLFANGGQARFNSVKAWEMAPSNPY